MQSYLNCAVRSNAVTRGRESVSTVSLAPLELFSAAAATVRVDVGGAPVKVIESVCPDFMSVAFLPATTTAASVTICHVRSLGIGARIESFELRPDAATVALRRAFVVPCRARRRSATATVGDGTLRSAAALRGWFFPASPIVE